MAILLEFVFSGIKKLEVNLWILIGRKNLNLNYGVINT